MNHTGTMNIHAIVIVLLCVWYGVHLGDCCPSGCVCSSPTKVRCDGEFTMTILSNVSTEVEVLSLVDTGVAAIPDGAFSTFSQLEFLFLHGNNVTEISRETFRGLNNLQWLIWTDSEINETSPKMFIELPSLTRLYLNRNKITSLANKVFRGLSNLISLRLDSNRISELRANTFVGVSSLELLDVTFNRISKIDNDAFLGLGELEELWLNNNEITELSTNVFRPLVKLQRLYLKRNLLTTISAFTEPVLPQLISLDVVANNITTFPANPFIGLSRLQILDLSYNNIKKLSEDFFNADLNITNLDLTANELESLPPFDSPLIQSFFGTRVSIDLNLNSIPVIGPRAFYGFHEMQLLHFSLDLSSTKLEELDKSAFEGINTEGYYIHLESNRLKSLDPHIFLPFDTKSRRSVSVLQNNIWLGNNQLSCDCHLKDFREWLQTKRTTIRTPLDIKCDSPDVYAGFSVLTVAVDDMVCSAPIFNNKTEWITANEGDYLTLDCSVTGVPQPDVLWITPLGELSPDKGVSTAYSILSGNQLVLFWPTRIHQGMYACVATNEVGMNVAIRYLEVNVPETFTKSPPPTDISSISKYERPKTNNAILMVRMFFVGVAVVVLGVAIACLVKKCVKKYKVAKARRMRRKKAEMEMSSIRGRTVYKDTTKAVDL